MLEEEDWGLRAQKVRVSRRFLKDRSEESGDFLDGVDRGSARLTSEILELHVLGMYYGCTA